MSFRSSAFPPAPPLSLSCRSATTSTYLPHRRGVIAHEVAWYGMYGTKPVNTNLRITIHTSLKMFNNLSNRVDCTDTPRRYSSSSSSSPSPAQVAWAARPTAGPSPQPTALSPPPPPDPSGSPRARGERARPTPTSTATASATASAAAAAAGRTASSGSWTSACPRGRG